MEAVSDGAPSAGRQTRSSSTQPMARNPGIAFGFSIKARALWSFHGSAASSMACLEPKPSILDSEGFADSTVRVISESLVHNPPILDLARLRAASLHFWSVASARVGRGKVKRKLNRLAEEQVRDTSAYVPDEGRRYPWNVAAHAIM